MPIVTASSRSAAVNHYSLITIPLKRTTLTLLMWLALNAQAENSIYSPQIKSLQTVVNEDWLSPTVMRLYGNDVLHVAFDELSHDSHRYIYRLEHCEADWTASDDIFESDWLEGFNNNTIDDYEHSINTVVPYTHYQLHFPNDRCRLKLSGNYRIYIIDDDTGDTLASVEFMVTEQTMLLSMAATTNTDTDVNGSHQQVSFKLSYGDWQVTDVNRQIQTVVMQNGREDTWRWNTQPSAVNHLGLSFEHCRDLIFDAGNEYRKFEVLDTSHPTMGIERIRWDGDAWQAFPFISEPRPAYIYDEDANGAFYIRNSDNRDNNITSDYVWVNYRLKAPRLPEGVVVIEGRWATEEPETYQMTYNEASGIYTASILQKQGYYSYQYLWITNDGQSHPLPSEGNFFETENRYQAMVYYKGTGERTWRLTSYSQITLR